MKYPGHFKLIPFASDNKHVTLHQLMMCVQTQIHPNIDFLKKGQESEELIFAIVSVFDPG